MCACQRRCRCPPFRWQRWRTCPSLLSCSHRHSTSPSRVRRRPSPRDPRLHPQLVPREEWAPLAFPPRRLCDDHRPCRRHSPWCRLAGSCLFACPCRTTWRCLHSGGHCRCTQHAPRHTPACHGLGCLGGPLGVVSVGCRHLRRTAAMLGRDQWRWQRLYRNRLAVHTLTRWQGCLYTRVVGFRRSSHDQTSCSHGLSGSSNHGACPDPQLLLLEPPVGCQGHMTCSRSLKSRIL